MDNRVSRLLDKAEAAADEGEIEKSDQYLSTASLAAFIAHREVRMLERIRTRAE